MKTKRIIRVQKSLKYYCTIIMNEKGPILLYVITKKDPYVPFLVQKSVFIKSGVVVTTSAPLLVTPTKRLKKVKIGLRPHNPTFLKEFLSIEYKFANINSTKKKTNLADLQ